MNFLDSLCEDAWFNDDRDEAIQIVKLFNAEITEYHRHLLEEIIFGVAELNHDPETINQGTHRSLWN